MEIVFRSDTGKKRKNNQDFAGYFINKKNIYDLTDMNLTKLKNFLESLKLNEEDEYGILDGGVFCVQALVDFDTYSKLNLEKLETSLEISKENKNTLTVTDDLIKDKYTKSTKESIEAFTKSRAIKLKNKHIKKGSLRITQAWF